MFCQYCKTEYDISKFINFAIGKVCKMCERCRRYRTPLVKNVICIHNNNKKRCLLCSYPKFDPVVDEAFISYLEYETFGESRQPTEHTDPLFEELLERLYY